jgi:hypothetical protein
MGAERRVEGPHRHSGLKNLNFGFPPTPRRNRIQNSSAAATGMVISLCEMISTVQLILNIILDIVSRLLSVNLFDIKD